MPEEFPYRALPGTPAIKFADGTDNIVRGLAFPFGGPFAGKDIHGETFGPDTELCLDWFPQGRPILFHHGLDGAVKTAVVGRQTEVETDDEGVWVKAQLDKRSRYYSRVRQLIDQQALGFSSGAMPHLVKTRKDGLIERWPWVELSLTPTEANPHGVVYAVKADYDYFDNNTEDEEPGNGAYSEHGGRVLADVSTFLERTDERVESRVKAGRTLSAANLEALRNLDGHLAGWEKDLAKKRERIAGLLNQSDPDAKKAIDDLETELLVADLRIAGLTL
jgi:hypothetical protein